ncbi:MAG: dienelactone hydrolase family protein [Betaproteobacteria bacterium]|nr:dienelactone hydrolase family protein [Betaproteobacteria bacterium]MDH5220881.1 dienelactone hydrolase family protein [Betaproteobacteria bacterium]MDH5349259.1 dienelactone hydrolase family protein [Betaproteobacteria bacterium]
MRKLLGTLTGFLAGALMVAGAASPLLAQPGVSSEMVSFTAATLRGTGTAVRGELRMPEAGSGALPAVLVLHTSAGSSGDRISSHYIDRLNRAGIATLRISMFPDSRSRPGSTRDVLPHTFGSLLFLTQHARVHPKRIGVLGFSYGGVMALVMASDELVQEYTGDKAKFAAHLALYPVCSTHLKILAGANPVYGASIYQRVTGAPVHVLAGELDTYDEPDSCPKFIAALREDVRKHFATTVYPGAHHVFDEPGANRQHRELSARHGVAVIRYNADAAEKAWAFAVQFFSENLATKN